MANAPSNAIDCGILGGVWDEGYCKCANEFCLGGNDADYCDILSLLSPEETLYLNYYDNFDLPIELVNPDETPIEGLQFLLEYDTLMVQLDSVSLNQNLLAIFYNCNFLRFSRALQ